MTRSRILLAAALLACTAPGLATAQSTGSPASGASPAGTPGSGNQPTPSTPAPSGGAATGKSAAGAETPLQVQEETKMKKDTSICKGC